MRCVLLLALTACSFERGEARSDARTGDASDSNVDTPDAGPCGATAIAASGAHTCVARSDGAVRCWGKNGQGELGRAPTASSICTHNAVNYACEPSPIDPMVPVTVTALGLGDQHSCAIGGGKVYCWGANDAGQFGSGMNGDEYAPYEVTARAGATAIAGGGTHTCSFAGSTVSCSGANGDGEVGNGTTNNTFTPHPAVTAVTGFGVGFQNVYAFAGEDVFAWGDNSTLEVDNSGVDPITMPLEVAGIGAATAIAGGTYHACAVLADQSAVCWGANNAAQLGRNTVTPPALPGPVTVTDKIVTLTAGTTHTCVRRSDNTVACWGEGYSAAGVTIALPAPAVAIASGSYHDCAILDGGTVWCWGWNPYGQIGNGTTGSSIDNTPRQVAICP